MSIKDPTKRYEKAVIHGEVIFTERDGDVYNIYNERLHYIESFSAPLEGLDLLEELHKCIIRNEGFRSI